MPSRIINKGSDPLLGVGKPPLFQPSRLSDSIVFLLLERLLHQRVGVTVRASQVRKGGGLPPLSRIKFKARV